MASQTELKNKAQLAEAAQTLAHSYELIQLGATTYIPVNWETEAPQPTTDGETIWIPLTKVDKLQLANVKSQILFSTDSEFRSFDFMLRQVARRIEFTPTSILVKTENGIRELAEDGQLYPHNGNFTPNYIRPMLNEDEDDKKFVFDTIAEWVNSEEEAISLLRHIATALAPHYAAVKYILFIGDGRNGKGVLLTMLNELFGSSNVSNVQRQMISERRSTVGELNGKLLNIVFDGPMTYIRDSSAEKTLTAGEPLDIELKYENVPLRVQTNALFVEALNTEPKNRDKTPALQKRLVRFKFPNIYAQDKAFLRKMTSERYLGALLSLLIDHYVREDELAGKLALTAGSIELQLEQVFLGSPVLQFLDTLTESPDALKKLEEGKMFVDDFISSFKPWMESQGFPERSDAALLEMVTASFQIGWKTRRDPQKKNKPTSKRCIQAIKPETLLALEQLKGVSDGTEPSDEELVGDGSLPKQHTDTGADQ